MVLHALSVLALSALAATCACDEREWCGARPQAVTPAGVLCGAQDPTGTYAQFLGVPYAKQPLGELRFKELQSVEPWSGARDATKEGPICFQRDVFYGPVMATRGQSEACIHANVYVPLRPRRARLLPVLVYVHGGGFDFGSGDPDAHGPQYLMNNDVIVITFNYRIGVFGFLSLNTASIPGNAGLRDMVTLLRWVQDNAESFGGDPGRVTLAGQSAGAAAAHLLSLSNAAQDGNLFHKVILMSGTATRSFFTTSPVFAQTVSNLFLGYLDINASDPEEAYRQLIALPPERLMEAHNFVQDFTGLVVFTPVVESVHEGVERIVDDDPETLQAQGRGKHIPFMIGFTNAECQTFQPRFKAIDIVKRIKEHPEITAPLGVAYTTLPENIPNIIAEIEQEYFNGTLSFESYLNLCSDSYFIYPALKLAKTRADNGGAVFLYRFAYNASFSVYKEALKLDSYNGAGHSEDLTFVFRANHVLGNKSLPAADSEMVRNMTTYITNFMLDSKPTKNHDAEEWAPMKKGTLLYKNIPTTQVDSLSEYQRMVKFFDEIYDGAES